jgi:nitroreductase
MDMPQALQDAVLAPEPPGRHGETLLRGISVAANALGAAVYVFIAATVVGWETCDIAGADGGADMAAGLFFFCPYFSWSA